MNTQSQTNLSPPDYSAFPHPELVVPTDRGHGVWTASPGLTKREWFVATLDINDIVSPDNMTTAGIAVILAEPVSTSQDLVEQIELAARAMAKVRVIYADALLAELNKEIPTA